MEEQKGLPLAVSSWDESEINAMHRVIASGKFTMGSEVRSFEKQFADFFGSKHAVMVNSGSSANLLALAAIKYANFKESLGVRNEVIVPAVSWSTTYYPVSQMGYKLKFVDVDLDTLNASARSVAEAIGPETAGIVAVNLLGKPSELAELRNLADEHGLFLVEDNCESMGATVGGKYAGTFGDIGTFSTFFSHHISTMEGGVCVTDDDRLADFMISMRAHGWTRELPEVNHVFNKNGNDFEDLYRFVLPGYNLRPLELSGAIGKEQIAKLESFIRQRKLNAKHFLSLDLPVGIRRQLEHGESSWFGFSLLLEGPLSGKRDALVAHLAACNIATRPIVAGNFTRNPVIQYLKHVTLPALPNADTLHVDGLFIGNHHFDISSELDNLACAFDTFVQ
jgi:CDP-6-deoxy-D-xylo-4-hexulose-3-dehydrase